MLAQRGADVSIVARNKERLDKALETLEVARPFHPTSCLLNMLQAARQTSKQILKAYSFAVDSEAGSLAAIKAASEPFGGRCPEAFFLVAGAARPSYFVEQDEELLRNGMQISYWAQACTALVCSASRGLQQISLLGATVQAGSKEMARQGVKGKIVFVSSVLAFFSIVGYSTYSPGKFAIRGNAPVRTSSFAITERVPRSRRSSSERTEAIRHRRPHLIPADDIYLWLRGREQDEARDHPQDRGDR